MKSAKNNTENLIIHRYNMKYLLAFEGILVGIVAGSIAVIYRLALNFSEQNMKFVLSYAEAHHWAIVAWFGALFIMALIVGRLVKWEPMISGSGIPQVEGELQGYFEASWIKVIIGKIIGGILCIIGGLSLGREGPSVQLGAMGGKGFSRIFKRLNIEERYLMTCGASAGLAAAFNAPLAGVMFALEEVHKNFSSTVLFSAMTASITADFVSKYVFGLGSVFNFKVNASIPLKYYGFIILLGIILGAAGAFYNYVLVKTQDLYAKMKYLKVEFRPIIPFLMAGILGFTLPQVLGGGHAMIEPLAGGKLGLGLMVGLLLVKFIFSMVSFGSGAPGGIFFPLLVLGAYIGGIYGQVVVGNFGIDPQYINNFIIIAMAGYFTAIVRAPITGIVLITEMTGSLIHLLPLTVVAVAAEITADMLKSQPIYEVLLDRILLKRGEEPIVDSKDKTLIATVVHHGAHIENCPISDIDWPEGCLLVSIRRGEKELIPNGATLIYPSDTIVALVNEADLSDVHAKMRELCGESD
ncbi:MAG: ClC family H(+)/Cl(-) exchange transporter [Eubacterium sp.]